MLIDWLKDKLESDYDHDECLIWPFAEAGPLPKTYGTLRVNGKMERTHRVAWEIHTGIKPSPLLEVRHLCGTSLSFNPYHLAIGTHKENEDDKILHGTRGIKLNEQIVREIRAEPGGATQALALKYGVTIATVYRIKVGKTWKHLLDG